MRSKAGLPRASLTGARQPMGDHRRDERADAPGKNPELLEALLRNPEGNITGADSR